MPAPDSFSLQSRGVRETLLLVRDILRWAIHDRIAQVFGSAFVLIMLWGTHGKVDLLSVVIHGWTGPGGDPSRRARLMPGLPWDQEWLAFAIGVLLLVLVPCLLIHFLFRERLTDYGLGLPKPGRWGFTLSSTALLAALTFPSMYIASKDCGMRAVYPFFRDFKTLSEFVTYELGYFWFFLVIEFTFRGYLLFGLYRLEDRMAGAALGAPGPLLFGRYAILVSMLSYTTWHLGKPLQEQYGTLIWGLITGAMALSSGTIWHIVLVHWGMNVFLDYLIWTSGR